MAPTGLRNPPAQCDLCGRVGPSNHIARHRSACPGTTLETLRDLLRRRGYSGVDDLGACWLPPDYERRPRPRIGYKRAHIAAYEAVHGPVPEGLVLCHRCDEPGCCNPADMWPGTQADNLRDMWAKGRGVHAGWMLGR